MTDNTLPRVMVINDNDVHPENVAVVVVPVGVELVLVFRKWCEAESAAWNAEYTDPDDQQSPEDIDEGYEYEVFDLVDLVDLDLTK